MSNRNRKIEVPCAVPEWAVEALQEIAHKNRRTRGEVSRMFWLHGLAAYRAGVPLEGLDTPEPNSEQLGVDDLEKEPPDAIVLSYSYKRSA